MTVGPYRPALGAVLGRGGGTGKGRRGHREDEGHWEGEEGAMGRGGRGHREEEGALGTCGRTGKGRIQIVVQSCKQSEASQVAQA